ncbi:hypothetical protein DFH08DRAFT_966797 [Mycena albidolilacea]|uniref:Uncharacterized protein n=1 Tax=Mycena albidolilacea TaxID=1033008 RepID=A0AAD6ZNC4_9AGAR|nr:hypothetical protein DFH08DRAFT_966797 [Mycena albidolilacea]
MNPTPLTHVDFNFGSSPNSPEDLGSSTLHSTARPRDTFTGPSSSPPHPTGSPSPGHSMSMPVAPILSPLVVDTIARDFGLEPKQLQLLRTFVGFGSLGPGLSLPDLATRLFMLAATLGEAAERRRVERAKEDERRDYRAIWRDLQIRLEETFCFTRQQKANIRGIVQEVIYDGNRTKFLTMHIDVLAVLEKRQAVLSLENIFGVPGRERSLSQITKRQCSSVRNAWRADLINSIDPKTFVTLADFVYASALKYKGGTVEELPQIYTVHAVLLRRFVFENPTLKAAPAEEEAPDSDIEYDEAEETRPRKKPKKTPAKKAGKIAKGENFWGRVDEWFKNEVAERGSSLTGPKWKSYVDQLILDDQSKFKGLAPGSAVVMLENRQPLESSSSSLFDLPVQAQSGLGGYGYYFVGGAIQEHAFIQIRGVTGRGA